MVPPKDIETLQNCCVVMKYLCQETNSKHLNTKVEEVRKEEPLMLKPEDFSSGVIGVEKVEVVGGETPFYLFPPQTYKFRRRRSFWDGNWSSSKLLGLFHHLLQLLLDTQLFNMKKPMAFKEAFSWLA